MDAAERVISILRADPLRWRLLGLVASLELPDCWVGAGFVRNAVWDHLHGRPPGQLSGDIDVVWHDPARAEVAIDRHLEAALSVAEPAAAWSVKNQARMHRRNGDAPYGSTAEAMRGWPETATAVAARRCGADGCEVAAPFGLGDLLGLVLRPTPRFTGEKRGVYERRAEAKGWVSLWPRLQRREA